MLNGQWNMVFFGFTYCPDICPGTLQALIRAKEELGTKGKDVRIVFISVDPARDRPKAIAEWLEANSAPAGTLGLTGTQAEVDRAVKAYRAVANKVGDFDASAQLMSQVWDILITLVWSGVVAFVILLILKVTIGIRSTDEDQEEGLDLADHGERAYNY